MKELKKLTRQMQDYLEEILLQIRKNKVARISVISKNLGVTRGSVSEAVKKLTKKGLVNHDHYGYITLTPHGQRIAKNVLERHNILKKFYMKVLQLPEKEAEENACRVEHVISDELFERVRLFLAFLESCPKGEPQWLNSFKYFLQTGKHPIDTTSSIVSLDKLKKGESGRVLKIQGPGLTQKRIMDLGIMPGSVVTFLDTAPLGDPLKIKAGSTNVMIRRADAVYIIVDRFEKNISEHLERK